MKYFKSYNHELYAEKLYDFICHMDKDKYKDDTFFDYLIKKKINDKPSEFNLCVYDDYKTDDSQFWLNVLGLRYFLQENIVYFREVLKISEKNFFTFLYDMDFMLRHSIVEGCAFYEAPLIVDYSEGDVKPISSINRLDAYMVLTKYMPKIFELYESNDEEITTPVLKELIKSMSLDICSVGNTDLCASDVFFIKVNASAPEQVALEEFKKIFRSQKKKVNTFKNYVFSETKSIFFREMLPVIDLYLFTSLYNYKVPNVSTYLKWTYTCTKKDCKENCDCYKDIDNGNFIKKFKKISTEILNEENLLWLVQSASKK
ncbi:hypothetical protein [Francisella salimarina]|uniref:Uncharacterized protein n=1 Tax=Francisella salimarina TaxID=2599927 RepID=A0AAJ4NM79_9GAMM|nr:hypothetical protein [Francisella salimarina]QWU98529.1 hypothetical protein KQR59_05285 [Francisella salimarina]